MNVATDTDIARLRRRERMTRRIALTAATFLAAFIGPQLLFLATVSAWGLSLGPDGREAAVGVAMFFLLPAAGGLAAWAWTTLKETDDA